MNKASFRLSGISKVSVLSTQGDRFCHRILQEICGKVTGSCRKTREISRTWNQYSRLEFPRFFPMISERILPESTGICRNPPKKIRKIPDRNTASNFLVFSVASRPFTAVRRSPGLYRFFIFNTHTRVFSHTLLTDDQTRKLFYQVRSVCCMLRLVLW